VDHDRRRPDPARRGPRRLGRVPVAAAGGLGQPGRQHGRRRRQGRAHRRRELDFLCANCHDFEASTSDTLNQLATHGKIHLVWHTLGLLDSASAPPGYSTRAANAAGCASDGGKLAAYGAALFASQPAEGGPGLTDDQLVDLGGPVGLNAPSFAQCVRNRTYASWVANVNAKAAQRNVNSTPTVYVDGQLLENPTPDSIRAAVTAAG
jgi:protein-disulfide isomerase